MSTLIDTASIDHPQIQTRALMCLVEIADFYYSTLAPDMDKSELILLCFLFLISFNRIFTLTMNGIKGGNAEVACQAIEFWSTVCDTEYDLFFEDEVFCVSNSLLSFLRLLQSESLNLIEKALPYLLPPLLESYHKRDYDDVFLLLSSLLFVLICVQDDEDSLNVAIAASRCVANIALVVRDKIVDHVLPVIQENITQEEWQKKFAALLSLFSAHCPSPGIRPLSCSLIS